MQEDTFQANDQKGWFFGWKRTKIWYNQKEPRQDTTRSKLNRKPSYQCKFFYACSWSPVYKGNLWHLEADSLPTEQLRDEQAIIVLHTLVLR